MNFPATPGGRILVAAMALMALLAAEGCRSRETVRFGIVVTVEAVVAAQLAASEINASGGIQGHPLELQVIAGGSSTRASLSLAAAEELSGDATVIGVVGHSNSSASLSAAQIYNARHLVQIAPTSSPPVEPGRPLHLPPGPERPLSGAVPGGPGLRPGAPAAHRPVLRQRRLRPRPAPGVSGPPGTRPGAGGLRRALQPRGASARPGCDRAAHRRRDSGAARLDRTRGTVAAAPARAAHGDPRPPRPGERWHR